MSLPNTFKALVAYGRGKEPKLGQLPIPKPGKNQILAKVAFAPINPSDIYTSNGLYPVNVNPPHAVGLEGSGTVVAVGEDLKVRHQVGDRVHLLGVGSYGEYMLAEADLCRKIKGDLSFEQAAPHYVNPFTAACMGDIVRKNGHKAVINTAGSSALGRMLIRYFNHKGIKTINIVRRDDYISELKKDGASYVLNSTAPDFEQQLKELADKEDATVAFDAIGGELTAQVLRNQPDGSSCYIYGRLGGMILSDLNVRQFIFQDKTLSGLWLNTYLKKAQKLGEAERILDEVYDLLPTVLSSNIQKVFKLDQIEEALAYYKDNSSKGKILVQPN